MKKISKRRKFLKYSLAGLTLAGFPNVLLSNDNNDYDVVVIGAGAAGLSATKTLIENGRKVLCIESSSVIGGRAITDNSLFNEPYDLGALWIENGEFNPFKKYGEDNGYNLYKERAEEYYEVYIKNKIAKDEDDLWKIYDGAEAEIAINAEKDIAPFDVAPDKKESWFNTSHMIIGPWEMGKNFTNYSCQDYMYDYGVEEGSTWHCKEGFGTLVNQYFKGVPVSLNTKVLEIDWSGKKVLIKTNKGSIKSNKCIITVSNGVLSSGGLKFSPSLDVDKETSFSQISMGHYNRIAFKFKKLFKDYEEDNYVYYKINNDDPKEPKGVGITINPSKSNLCICDVGGNFGKELANSGKEAAIDFAFNELKKIFGNRIEKDLIGSHFADWTNNSNILGGWASAEPGYFKYREILRQPVADKIYFAGEACAKEWGTVAGAYKNGAEIAKILS